MVFSHSSARSVRDESSSLACSWSRSSCFMARRWERCMKASPTLYLRDKLIWQSPDDMMASRTIPVDLRQRAPVPLRGHRGPPCLAARDILNRRAHTYRVQNAMTFSSFIRPSSPRNRVLSFENVLMRCWSSVLTMHEFSCEAKRDSQCAPQVTSAS